ncbi:uncharacterized protein EI90DRAFT_3195381 [Cantharellus anzutake]|uniref:uncharacterized protein n=1 Tax=Cantharellus anzutake TaxID=1750568 RepID=UPI001908DC4F|nr:uncharacterized protein EI90DRAFT_3195381 [Cantharellus anzutake]KAF8332085.1 hypothetical protein EI90DRAFT_3195381 [Cantharellus anzutake]
MIEVHNKLHDHVLHRRLNVSKEQRTGLPVDIVIKFIQASGLPKVDIGPGMLADPYFVADIDGKISYTSSAQRNTLNPVWNESWAIRNVPSDAQLIVDVYDKDEGSINDDYIGSFSAPLDPGAHASALKGVIRNGKGSFGYFITVELCSAPDVPRYTFDGPVRYSRHFSPTVGTIAKINNPNGSHTRLWSTWKISMRGVYEYFGHHRQHWNIHYKAAQSIFEGPMSLGARASIQAGHRLLYANSTANGFGLIDSAEGFWGLFRAGEDRPPSSRVLNRDTPEPRRIKPAVYTYTIGEDGVFRFSETGASFFVDFVSKHALHSCCTETVIYSGEFHPRPAFPDGSGWAFFEESMSDDSVSWELVIDNNSGTYAPDKAFLPALKGFLQYNLPGLRVITFDYKDDELALKASTDSCQEYALAHRRTELQPTLTSEGNSLHHMAIVRPVE